MRHSVENALPDDFRHCFNNGTHTTVFNEVTVLVLPRTRTLRPLSPKSIQVDLATFMSRERIGAVTCSPSGLQLSGAQVIAVQPMQRSLRAVGRGPYHGSHERYRGGLKV